MMCELKKAKQKLETSKALFPDEYQVDFTLNGISIWKPSSNDSIYLSYEVAGDFARALLAVVEETSYDN